VGYGPATHVLEFRILGPFEARQDGEVVRIGGPKQRALLAILVLTFPFVLAASAS